MTDYMNTIETKAGSFFFQKYFWQVPDSFQGWNLEQEWSAKDWGKSWIKYHHKEFHQDDRAVMELNMQLR